jgi:hypothetical protein
MANNKNFIAKNGVSTGDGYAMPDVRPSLLLDFANSKTLDPRITFTRGSTATYWDGHTTTKAEENLFSGSTTFSGGSFGMLNGSSKGSGFTAPDGTSTAYSIIITTAATDFGPRDNSGWSAGTYTTSVYAKAGSTNYLEIDFTDIQAAYYTLTGSGTVSGLTGGATGTITSVGNGWYRCTMTATSGSLGFVDFQPAPSASTRTWDGTQSAGAAVYLWGPQLEQRSSATAYTATTSSPIVKYQPTLQTAASGEARFDYDPLTGESKGLLIEEAKTNLETQSQTFSTYSLSTGVSLLTNSVIAPDGTQTGVTFRETDGTSAYQRMSNNYTVSSGSLYTISMYAKAGLRDYFTIDTGPLLYYNLTTGVVSGATGSVNGYGMEDVGNGWYRCWYTETTTSTSLASYIGTSVNGSDGGLYTGIQFDSIYIWGLQVEVGAFPTSYIPTSGSTVTRSLDSAEITGTSFDFFNNQESTFYAELDMTYSGANSKGVLSVNADVSGATGRLVNMYLSSSLQFYYDSYSFGSTVASGNGGNAPPSKVAVGFTTTSYLGTSDGQLIGNTSGSYYLDQAVSMKIGGTYNGNSYPLNGHLKKIACYPKQLTSAALQQMTEE